MRQYFAIDKQLIPKYAATSSAHLHLEALLGQFDVDLVTRRAAETRRLSDADLAAVPVDDVEATTAQDAATAACDVQKSR